MEIQTPPMINGSAAMAARERLHSRLMLGSLGLTLATSSFVFVEPAPYDVLVLVLFGGLLITGLRFPREIQLAAMLLGLFSVGNVIAAAASVDPLTTIRSLSIRVYMVLAWLFFASLIVVRPEPILRTIWWGYQIAAIIAVAWGALEYFGYIQFGDWQSGLRAKGPFKDPNVFAPFLVPASIYALSRLATRHRWPAQAWYAVLYVWLVFGVLISFSRGAWLNFAIASAFFSVCALVSLPTYRAKLRWMLINAMLILAAVAVLGVSATKSSIADRLVQRAVFVQKYDLARGGRFYTQQQALQKIATTPQGIGPGRSDEEFGLEPHNLFLHIFVEGGWLAGSSFLLFLALSLYRSLRLFLWKSQLRAEFYVVFASILGMLTQSLFIDSTHWRHFWLLFAMLWGLIICHQRAENAARFRNYDHSHSNLA